MRGITVIIILAVGAYMTWKMLFPVPEIGTICRQNTDCPSSSTLAVSAISDRPGLRISLYDPESESREPDGPESSHEILNSLEEPVADFGVDGAGERLRMLTAGPAEIASIRVEGVDQPGVRGFCLSFGSGGRKCLAFVNSVE
jgi:hypothetical protein